MLAPVVTKVLNSKEVLIERVMPVPGQLIVTENATVVPFDHIGVCNFSQKLLKLPKHFRPAHFKKPGQFYYTNNLLGKNRRSVISAPYNGHLYAMPDGDFEFREDPKKYTLLSGVWGKVAKIVDKNAVLIKADTKDINLVAATKSYFAGELVVFPNPSHLLEKFYLEGFASGASDGKIIYVGNHVSLSLLKDAVKYGVGGIVAGSADTETYRFAVSSGVSFGIFGGFGDIATPDEVYTILNNVPNRYVFFQGERNLLRIPMPPEQEVSSIEPNNPKIIAEVEKGMRVLVLQRPYFGKSGVVDRVAESSIFVRFSINENPVEVRLPNFFILNNL